ncbi:MAG TPA: acyl carrier protein [Azospirillum sp.]
MTKAQIFDIVKKNIVEVLPDLDQDMIALDKSLSDLGANSVDRMEIIQMSMDELSVNIPLMSFAKATNIDGVVEVLLANRR